MTILNKLFKFFRYFTQLLFVQFIIKRLRCLRPDVKQVYSYFMPVFDWTRTQLDKELLCVNVSHQAIEVQRFHPILIKMIGNHRESRVVVRHDNPFA